MKEEEALAKTEDIMDEPNESEERSGDQPVVDEEASTAPVPERVRLRKAPVFPVELQTLSPRGLNPRVFQSVASPIPSNAAHRRRRHCTDASGWLASIHR